MPAAARVDPKTLFTPEEWARLSVRSSWRGLALVAHAWGVIALAIAAGVVWPWTIPLGVLVVGTRQLGLAILMHEAAHAALHPDRRINDAVGHWLCAVPVGASLAAYRPYHLAHHRFAQQPEDPDLVLSAPFPVSRASLRRKILRDLTGRTFLKQRLVPLAALLTGRTIRLPDGARVTARSAAPFLAFNLGLFAVLAGLGVWWSFFVLWLLPMATWFPMVTRVRNIAEHACTPDDADPFRHARTTHASLLERAFIAPYGVNFHAEHHLFMHLPCWRLPQAHRLLAAKGVTARMEVRTGGYREVLRLATR